MANKIFYYNPKPEEFIEGEKILTTKGCFVVNSFYQIEDEDIDLIIANLKNVKESNPDLAKIECSIWTDDDSVNFTWTGYRTETDEEYIARKLKHHEDMIVYDLQEQAKKKNAEEEEYKSFLRLKEKFEKKEEK